MSPLSVLQTYWHYDSFRPLQAEIIQSVLDGNDTLALLPTGGGKSLCFQVPTMVMAMDDGRCTMHNGRCTMDDGRCTMDDGRCTMHNARCTMEPPDPLKGERGTRNDEGTAVCLVVTPLIALMKDQVENLKRRGIHAAAIYTGMSRDQQHVALDNCQFGPYHFLYVSPERLESEAFRKRLAQLPICLIAIDEAHCISQWGYDFRPSYLNIVSVRQLLPEVPVLALTATATPDVVKDITEKLSLQLNTPWNIFRQSFARTNLQYIVRYCEDTQDSSLPESKPYQLLHILRNVKGSAIVYVRNRKRAQELSEYINAQLPATTTKQGNAVSTFFHAGLSNSERTIRQEAWKHDSVRIIVATNAFGMGIDKPDVRLVIHYDLPDSIEAYFQEAGRAGRDGKTAYAVLLYAPSDKTKAHKRVNDNYPSREFIEDVYHKTCDYFQIGEGSGLFHSFALHIDDLCRAMRLPLLQTYSALQILAQAGYIDFQDEQETAPRVQINVSREALYDYTLSQEQDDLLNLLMRKHTGIFSELQYISLTPHNGGNAEEQHTHEILVALAQRGIITYVPRTVACLFTLIKERQATIYLTQKVYDERLHIYAERLRAMVEYAEQKQFCRSQVLLAYFGESDAVACDSCDVCRNRKRVVTQ